MAAGLCRVPYTLMRGGARVEGAASLMLVPGVLRGVLCCDRGWGV